MQRLMTAESNVRIHPQPDLTAVSAWSENPSFGVHTSRKLLGRKTAPTQLYLKHLTIVAAEQSGRAPVPPEVRRG